MNPWLIACALAYLLGSIPFGYLLVRLFLHQDIRTTGSGNIGATNVARSGAKKLGILTLVLDCFKGSVAVLLAFQIARHSDLNPAFFQSSPQAAFSLASAAAVFAILGHVFPVWLRFRGGKGVATALGVFLVLSPRSVGWAVLVFAAIFGITRFVSLASIFAAAIIPLAYIAFIRIRAPWPVAAFFGIPLLVIVKHRSNIRRLLGGIESRFGGSNRAAE